MIRVVGANPAMDRIATWPPVALGAVNRATDVLVLAGGKGLNVCRGVRALGEPVAAYGFVGGDVGRFIRAGCATAGIEDRLTTVAGATRVSMIVVEPAAGRTTVLNEPGPEVTLGEAEALLATLRADCRPGDLVILSGTLPLGLPPSIGARIVATARDAGARTIVDSSGPVLRAAVAERPWLVKCNAGEFAGLERDVDASGVAPAPDDPTAFIGPARRLIGDGVGLVVITLGGDGLLAVSTDRAVRVRPPAVGVVNVTGAGDVLLAGLAVELAAGAPLDDALALATACAAGSVARLAPEAPSTGELAELLARVTIEAVAA